MTLSTQVFPGFQTQDENSLPSSTIGGTDILTWNRKEMSFECVHMIHVAHGWIVKWVFQTW